MGDGHQLARTRMVQLELGLAMLVEHALDPRQRLHKGLHFRQHLSPLHIDMRHLVIGDGERGRRTRVELLPPELIAHLDEAGLAQRAIDVHRPGHLGHAVLR